MSSAIHKNVGLTDVDRMVKGRTRTTYPLKVPVDHIARVEVVEAFRNVRYLMMVSGVR